VPSPDVTTGWSPVSAQVTHLPDRHYTRLK
jgi:hypothetical protein